MGGQNQSDKGDSERSKAHLETPRHSPLIFMGTVGAGPGTNILETHKPQEAYKAAIFPQK